MPTRNINLTEHLDRFIESEVGSGQYGNASEVVREGLRLMERRNAEERAKLEWLRGAVHEVLGQFDAGALTEIRSAGELEQQIDQLWTESCTEAAKPGECA
jgi:antitoxin ParD1/3/4